MDKREIEILMDKYKKEMLEFSKRNGYSNSDPNYEPNERERKQFDAEQNQTAYERDRSDPVDDDMITVGNEPEALPAQTAPQAEISQPINYGNSVTDTVKFLKDSCNSPSTDEQRRRCKDISDYLSANPETGTMRIETYAADRAFAVPSARVMVFLPLSSGNVTLYDGITDISGSTQRIILPAPPRIASMSPNNSNVLPYSVYSVYVEHPSYVREMFSNVPVFSGIESVQPVQMIAKVEGVSEPEPIAYNESGYGTL